jgi:hypothetical protein
MTPLLGLMLRPAGSAPVVIDQVSGKVPPAAVIVRKYGAVAVPPGTERVVIVNVSATVMDSSREAIAPALSLT